MADNEAATAKESSVNGAESPRPPETVAIHKQEKNPPKKPLPTTRISFVRQLEILRAFAAASGDPPTPVGLNEVSALTKIANDTLSVANRFFVPVGLITKTEIKFTPSQAVREFGLSHQWGHEDAAHQLAPQLAKGWFWQVLEPFLKMGSMQEGEAINKLALASQAAPEYQPQILVLLNYLDTCGLVQREGKTMRLGPAAGIAPAAVARPATQPPADEEPETVDDESIPVQRQTQGAITTAFSQEPEGALRVMVSINVPMSELRDWPADRVTALLGGVAQVLTAKAAAEKESAK